MPANPLYGTGVNPVNAYKSKQWKISDSNNNCFTFVDQLWECESGECRIARISSFWHRDHQYHQDLKLKSRAPDDVIDRTSFRRFRSCAPNPLWRCLSFWRHLGNQKDRQRKTLPEGLGLLQLDHDSEIRNLWHVYINFYTRIPVRSRSCVGHVSKFRPRLPMLRNADTFDKCLAYRYEFYFV